MSNFNRCFILRYLKAIVFLIFFALLVSPAFAATKSKAYIIDDDYEFKGHFITNCKIYQFGSEELAVSIFIKKQKDKKNFPEPDIELDETNLKLTFGNTHVKKSKKSNKEPDFDAYKNEASALAPSVINFSSYNKNESAVIEIETDSTMSIFNKRKTRWGFQLRLKLKNNPKVEVNKFKLDSQNSPKNSLPFANDSRITLELRDAELKDLLRVLCQHIDKNVIVDPSMPNPSITMSLNNVKVGEVFNFLMKTYGIYAYSAGDNTIAFGSREGLHKLSGEEELKIFPIAYADPDTIKTILSNLTKVPEANFITDKRLRNIYVKANPSVLNEISRYLEKIDTPGKQIMIHASIFEFSDSATRDVEHALNAVYDHYNFNFDSDSGGSLVGLRRWPEAFKVGDDEVEINSGKAELVIYNQFTALESKGKGKVLANPSVIAIDGQEAKISMTEDYPYVSARDDDGNVTWSTQNVGPQLTFTPKIGRNGEVNLKINIETGEVIEMMRGSNGEQMPRTSKRSVNTEIRVKDGMPFVIGGLFRENNSRGKNKIPILGDIPLLGWLFSGNSKSNIKTQVVIIVTPYIIDSHIDYKS